MILQEFMNRTENVGQKEMCRRREKSQIFHPDTLRNEDRDYAMKFIGLWIPQNPSLRETVVL